MWKIIKKKSHVAECAMFLLSLFLQLHTANSSKSSIAFTCLLLFHLNLLTLFNMAIDWSLYESDIKRWYLDERKSANDVIQLLLQTHNVEVK